MPIKNNDLEQEIDKKFARRDKKKSHPMKVSGKSVFKLKQIIVRKSTKTKNFSP